MKRKRLAAIACVLIYLGGVLLFAWPDLYSLKTGYENKKAAEAFRNEFFQNTLQETQQETDRQEKSNGNSESSMDEKKEQEKKDELYQAMQSYNQQIFSNGQSGLSDPWSYEQESLDLTQYGINDSMIGILDIPKMGVTLPLYLGATQEKMAKGGVMLGQTSFPVEGTDSNCVIAAHRGWKGIPMFREIERLEIGDELTIQNCRETLTYRVSEIEIILPDESDRIMIQPRRNRVTLITCHPYTKNSRRYVVYCDETGKEQETEDTENSSILERTEQIRTAAMKEDQSLLERDTLWRKIGYVGIGILGILILIRMLSIVGRKTFSDKL